MNEATDDRLAHQQEVWESWAQADPLWAILSDPARRGRRWDVDEFFATGKPDVDQALAQAGAAGLPARRGRALDFGCGVGRLTQALGAEFEHADGVDISDTMIDLARQYNKLGERCEYHVNLASDLALFDDRTMDFVFSTIVLQHVPPQHAATYITEFVRLLAPGGAAVFDMTASMRTVALPAGAHQASIAVAEPRAAFSAGQSAILTFTVTNASDLTWPAGSLTRLGNHWRTPDGEAVAFDDGRTSVVQSDVESGGSVTVNLTVAAPSRPGEYVLELDVVEEGVTWFAQQGSAPLGLAVQVTERRPAQTSLRDRLPWARKARTAAESDPTEADIDPEPFSMDGVPRAEVEALVTAADGIVVHVEPSGSSGPEWEAYRYVVTRD